MRVSQLARRVGYVFQNRITQSAPTVAEELAFGLRLQGLAEEEIARRVEAALVTYGLDGCAELPPAALSVGQRRQVTLAAVMAIGPAVLVLDEPTGGLDWQSRQELIDRLRSYNAQGGTVILISHDVRVIAEAGRRSSCFTAGRSSSMAGRPPCSRSERCWRAWRSRPSCGWGSDWRNSASPDGLYGGGDGRCPPPASAATSAATPGSTASIRGSSWPTSQS